MEKQHRRNVFELAQEFGLRLVAENFGKYRLYRVSRKKEELYDKVYAADGYDDILRYLEFYEQAMTPSQRFR